MTSAMGETEHLAAWRRRGLLAVAALAWLGGCSSSGPDEADALQQIGDRIRSGYSVGEKQVTNLVYKSGIDQGSGRFVVLVDYDLVSTVPDTGVFSTQERSGQSTHVSEERYTFVKSGGDWRLE